MPGKGLKRFNKLSYFSFFYTSLYALQVAFCFYCEIVTGNAFINQVSLTVKNAFKKKQDADYLLRF